MSIYLDILAKNINTFLEKNFKRPAWLAEVSGVKAPNISKILNRTGNPTLETIAALAIAMEIEPGDLVRYYQDQQEFELVIIENQLHRRKRELELLNHKYERMLNPDARGGVHPSVVKRDIENTENQIERLERKAQFIRFKLSKQPHPALESKQASKEIAASLSKDDQGEPTRAEAILALYDMISKLSNKRLGMVREFIDDLENLENEPFLEAHDEASND